MSWTTVLVIGSEQRSNGLLASVAQHSGYATIRLFGSDGFNPPQRPIIRTALGLGPLDVGRDDINAASAFFRAFAGPIPLVMRTKSFNPQRRVEFDPEASASFRTGFASKPEAANT